MNLKYLPLVLLILVLAAIWIVPHVTVYHIENWTTYLNVVPNGFIAPQILRADNAIYTLNYRGDGAIVYVRGVTARDLVVEAWNRGRK